MENEDQVEQRTKEEILADFEERDGKYVHKLSEPITFGTSVIKEFVLDRPKAKHMRQMSSKPNTNDILRIIGKLANQPDSVVDDLEIVDMNALAEYFGAFS